jgi:hypothetical protein
MHMHWNQLATPAAAVHSCSVCWWRFHTAPADWLTLIPAAAAAAAAAAVFVGV